MKNFFQILFQILLWKEIFFNKFFIEAYSKGQCMGKHQIPLQNQKAYDVITQPYEAIIFNNFKIQPRKTFLKNDGRTIIVKMLYDNNLTPSINLGVRLGGATFRFEFLYFQWFEKSSTAYNYKNYSLPAELHAVFYDDACKTFDEAIKLRKTVVVIAIGLEIFTTSTNLAVLGKNLENVSLANTEVPIENLRLTDWLSKRMDEYYLYDGYLMIFNCEIPVIWIDIQGTIIINPQLVEKFYKLKSSQGEPLIQQYTPNLRPALKIYKVLYESLKDHTSYSSIPFVDAYDHKYKANSASGIVFRQLQAMNNVGFCLFYIFLIFLSISLIFFI